jgi:transcriptional regulator with XRE-family HTH domain
MAHRPAVVVAARFPPRSVESSTLANTAPPLDAAGKVIHFGQFIRYHRLRAGKTTEAFGREIGLTGRRVIGIEAMATPDVQQTTLTALARALQLDPDELDSAWRRTPVPLSARRAGPTTEAAQRFAAACRAAGISPAEGLRRLRGWLIAQDEPTQQQVLRCGPPDVAANTTPPTLYTDLVDHLQDPAQTTRQRISARAGRSRPRPQSARAKK